MLEKRLKKTLEYWKIQNLRKLKNLLKMVVKYRDEGNRNARIKIDYSSLKPKVSFSYPSKKNQVNGNMFFPVYFLFLIVFVLIDVVIIEGLISDKTSLYNEDSLKGYTLCALDNQTYILSNYSLIRDKICIDKIETFSLNFKHNLLSYQMLILLFIAITPLFIYFLFKKKWDMLFPKYQAFLSRKKIAIFKSQDVIFKDALGYYCEIPVFSNIILDYNATEDFSKYLNLFEIQEHKFEYMAKRKKHKINEWLWYARFYFTKKPEKGELKVIFK